MIGLTTENLPLKTITRRRRKRGHGAMHRLRFKPQFQCLNDQRPCAPRRGSVGIFFFLFGGVGLDPH
jgi:hypothetical protein